ncbi:SAM-dependent methyltransferase [Spirosoma taeanense]|uniref:SAM-dependent methyltransferase n=2 Tax=Spirosoma taeanense TaxID=2735870 RepID=A0A6M5YGB4_9BACT|nr:SAM-dependent methyltransferase [Spirosoma taeanense]
MLRPHPAGLDLKKLAAQIGARQKAREKLPTWYASDEVVFPPALSFEQASSERTAMYKASLVQGARLVDLTGGMGVDSWAFAQYVKRVEYVEQQPELASLAAHNLPLLGALNVTVQAGNSLAFVENLTESVDWLYLDPHRRDERGGKVVRLEDCEPDVSRPDVLTNLLARTNRILLKTSPLIDIDATIRQLATGSAGSVETVHVVAVQGEVKEVLFVLTQQAIAEELIEINAVNLLSNRSFILPFNRKDERRADVSFGNPQHYIYEPNAAVLKAGAFKLAASRYNLTKLAPNSHLYTSDALRPDFPGRVFSCQQTIKPDARSLRALVPTMQANLTVRNFPQSVAELRKKLNLREGGDTYLFATTLLNGDKRLLVTQKI